MISTNLPKRSDRQIDWNLWFWIVEKVRKLLNTHYDPTKFVVRDEGTGSFVSLRSDITKDKETPQDFGIKSVSGVKVELYGGSIQIGTTEKTCADTSLTIVTSTAYLGWQYNFGTDTLTIINFGSIFTPSVGCISKWEHLCTKTEPLYGSAFLTFTKDGIRDKVFPANYGSDL